MPEGDTIHRAASRLRPALAGRTVVRFDAPRLLGDRPRPGAVVEDVEAVGKHLLVHFIGGLSLRTHMRMTGSWHLYRTGQRWQKPPYLARVTLEVDGGVVAVCFSAPVVETYRRAAAGAAAVPGTAALAHLGPDLCRPDADLAAALDRMDALTGPDDEIHAVLLDQRVASGIGNVYKSETLFCCRVGPFTRMAFLDVATRERLLATAARLLQANLTNPGPRETYQGGLAVYGRRGRPCPRCGTAVRMARRGHQARSTYWCPRCQPGAP